MQQSVTRKFLVPLAFPRLEEAAGKEIHVLAGDVGGTKTNLALFRMHRLHAEAVHQTSYPSRSYDSLTAIIKQFLADFPHTMPDRVCIGVAGPVLKGKVDLTNLSWELDSRDIRKATGIGEVALINDLESTAYGLAALQESDLFAIREGDFDNGGNMAILAPGTGLGEAGLFWNGQTYHPFATEGGHCDFAPRTDQDMALLQHLQEKFDVVSWEHVVSGPGIFNIYTYLREAEKREEPRWLTEALKKAGDPTAVISEAAAAEKAPICREAMRLFVRYLAHEACNLVLKLKASGGLFLGGGIPPKITNMLLEERFYTHYRHCDRMQSLVESVPICVIQNDKTALLGAAYYGAYGAAG
ncbi:glucokinase [Compostibacter hankyongensis]